MAKKNKNEAEQTEKSGGFLSGVIVFLIILIWIAIFVLLIKLDVGGLGNNILRPILKDVPIVNMILPPVSDEQIAFENSLAYSDILEANNRIKELEILLDELKEENADLVEENEDLTATVEKLKHYEDEMEAFEERVQAFDKEVVFNDKAPSVEEYIKWYESMYPENAERIYEMAIQTEAYDLTIQQKAGYYEKMKAADAAAILEIMSAADIDYVCDMLYCMKTQSVSDILSKMTELGAAKITKRMAELDAAKFDDWVTE